jgi:L-alanine-DL-glutamate epimerase-like enolase superfamily enzyme
MTARSELRLERIETTVCRVPTDRPEADGTYEWDSTTVVYVEVVARGGLRGLGWSYTSAAAEQLVHSKLKSAIEPLALEDTGAAWQAMVDSVRNIGRPGLAATAISAVDVALWDLRARSLDLPLFKLLGPWHDSVPVYGSGGFTSYTEAELVEQLGGWVAEGIPRVKMKIGVERGRDIARDLARIGAVRKAIGPDPELFVDANGAYTVKEAIHIGRELAGQVTYFEEPVSSDQLAEMASVRGSIPQQVAAGEYGYDPWYFDGMLRARAVDILQADATRCLGITGFISAARLAQGAGIPFSGHTSPAIHAHAACAAPTLAHVEYFHDHVRIERMLLDGAPVQRHGELRPDPARAGLGLELKRADAERHRAA